MSVIAKKNKKSKEEKKRENKGIRVRMVLVATVITIGFACVIGKMTYIVAVKGDEYKQAAYAQQTTSEVISPNRGTIYDSNGEVLAVSVSVDTVSVNPGEVRYANNTTVDNETLATKFSEIFEGVTYENVMSQLESDSSVVVIARKVESDKIDELEAWMEEEGITTGINIDEDYKRYYPNGSLASTLIGFCGTDNTGLYGLEERWNSVLTGTSGQLTVTSDVNGDAISDELEEYVASENGSNIYLTIDSQVQGIAEKYLQEAVEENQATYGGVIIMNPQNGEILAMANYPDYDLNDPQNVEATGLSDVWDTLDSDTKNSAFYELWANKNVSYLYEPGSTFKLLISAIGLEEGVVETDTEKDFLCEGYYTVVEGEPAIACWRYYNPHGELSLRGALEGSCNPAFMQLGQRIGTETLYKYFRAFGLFDRVGTDIAYTPNSIFTEESKVGPIELATMSFGQRFSITPLQLVTAVSSIVNGGTLIEPKIVKQIENTDTGSVTTVEDSVVRQVISVETSEQVKDMMKSVVTDGTGGHAAVSGYEIGGKSGTSEPTVGNEDEGFVASFIGISPIENTEVVCFLALYGLTEEQEHQGGTVCGPVVGEILSEVLPYLGVTSTNSTATDTTEATVVEDTGSYVSSVTGQTVASARAKLEANGFEVVVPAGIDENVTLVTDQMPKAGSYLENGSTIYLYTSENDVRTSVAVPDVKGMSISEATSTLQNSNLNVIVEGTTGVVISQSITSGKEVEEGTIVTIVVKEELVDTQ